jgi:hypothetical protein
MEADIIVVNHSLFFSDLAIRASDPKAAILPNYSSVIFDEAHHLEDVVSNVFGVELSNNKIHSVLNRIIISRKGTAGTGFIADHKDERVQKFQLKDGKILATWGRQGWGPGEFDWVHGVVVDSKGAVYAADTYGQRIQKFVSAVANSTASQK